MERERKYKRSRDLATTDSVFPIGHLCHHQGTNNSQGKEVREHRAPSAPLHEVDKE